MPLLITGMEKCACCSDKGSCASFDGLVERDSGFLTHVLETSAISTALRVHGTAPAIRAWVGEKWQYLWLCGTLTRFSGNRALDEL